MLIKQDEAFDQTAADPVARRAAIADLTSRRTLLFWASVIASIGVIVTSFRAGSAAGAFTAAIMWSLLFKFESDLRLLRVIDRLQRDRDEKPMA